jgi:hypothetical protein
LSFVLLSDLDWASKQETRKIQMQLTQHNVETITYKTEVFEGFSCVTMMITDQDGVALEVKLFADQLDKMTFVNKGIRVVGR